MTQKTLVNFAGYSCEIRISRYATTNNIAIQLVMKDPDEHYYEPIATATVNAMPLPDNQIAVKDYSENEGMMDALAEAGVIETYNGVSGIGGFNSGFVAIPIAQLSRSFMKEHYDVFSNFLNGKE